MRTPQKNQGIWVLQILQHDFGKEHYVENLDLAFEARPRQTRR